MHACLLLVFAPQVNAKVSETCLVPLSNAKHLLVLSIAFFAGESSITVCSKFDGCNADSPATQATAQGHPQLALDKAVSAAYAAVAAVPAVSTGKPCDHVFV